MVQGFAKIALLTGAHLVPCYGFGENELFTQAANDQVSSLTMKFE